LVLCASGHIIPREPLTGNPKGSIITLLPVNY